MLFRSRLLAIPSRERMRRILQYVLDENEFLSPHGIRSLSRIHDSQPFTFDANGQEHRVNYVPGDSDSSMFGGNSNWRGPVWFPLNYLLIESLERYDEFYGADFRVECPTGSGVWMTLGEVAEELMRRQISLFMPGPDGHRPCFGGDARYRDDPTWNELSLFHEYFDGETGRGLGASHQTGWTGILAGAGTIFFAYIGFEAVSTAGQEARDPKRDMPFGIIGSLVVCTGIYMLVAAIMTLLVP